MRAKLESNLIVLMDQRTNMKYSTKNIKESSRKRMMIVLRVQ